MDARPLALPAFLLVSLLSACPGKSFRHRLVPLTTADVTMAVIPFRNLTADVGASQHVTQLVQEALESRGVEFVPGEQLEALLKRERIRYTDSMDRETVRWLHEEMGADYVLLGSLLRLESRAGPRISLAARLLRAPDGNRVRSLVCSLQGEDFEGLLGRGTISEMEVLLDEVVARVQRVMDPRMPFPAPDEPPALGSQDLLQLFVAEGFKVGAVQRIAVLPLANYTSEDRAEAVFSEVLSDQWFQVRAVQVVERSELLAAMARARVRSIYRLDNETLRQVGEDLGTRYFLHGTIREYEPTVQFHSWRVPSIEATVRLLDVEAGGIVAAATLRGQGSQYHVLLGLGVVKDPVDLVALAAQQMISSILGV